MALGRPRLPIIVAVVCAVAIPLFFIAKRATLNGGYTMWNGWGACSSDCGEGIRVRTRTCTNPIAGRFGKTCLQLGLGEPQEEENCKIKECPIDGRFADWGEYGDCTKTCGTDGVKTRKRTCTNPLPQYGGKPCVGASEETQSCNVKPCPVNGGFSEWGSFGDCDKTCGPGGIKRRTRTCTNPPPSEGGKNCEGAVDQVEECNNQPCPGSDGFTAWSEFGNCSVSCGSGVQARNRTCTLAKADGGKDCEGPAEETKECNTDPCPPAST